MKKLALSLLLFVVCLPALALEPAVNTNRFSETAIKGYDPVAYFTEGKPVEGSDDFTLEWRDGLWHFASQENLELFKANPTQYAPQYGGWCAYAMSDRGKTVRTDPEAWYIKDGKLYLNYSKSVQKTWLQGIDTNIVEADGFYPKTTDVLEWIAKESSAAK